MTAITKYSDSAAHWRTTVIITRCFTLLLWLVLLLHPQRAYSQINPDYDEISVFLEVPGMGGMEIDAVIRQGEVYLPVADLFDFLKIKNIPSAGLDTITGFFITQEATYGIYKLSNRIIYGEKTFVLEPGSMIRTESNLYLRSVYFGSVFGLDCIFEFRNLSVTIKTRLELPVIREMRLEEMRLNMLRLKGEVKADTTIGRSYPLFHFGMADWSVISTEQIRGPSDVRLNLSLGAIIAGGETTLSLNYDSRTAFSERQQYYLWRYVNNNSKAIRQIMAGKIASHATSSIYNPVVGVQITNTPTTFRRSFGSYILSDKTEPGWIVELYVNNILIDYIKADASGFFTFEVPLVYGNSVVRLKFYGPWGEERSSEQNITIPFNFVPKNTLEYTLSAGMVEDTLFSRFSRTSFNYGLTRGITLGTGFEYLSSVSSGPFMPYVNASFKIVSNLLLSAEYTHSVRAKGTLTYRLPSNLQLELNYIKYVKDQKAINFNFLEERKAVLTIPLRIKKVFAYNRFTFNQLIMPATRYTTAEWMISGSVGGVNTNLTTYALFIGEAKPDVYSNLSVSIRFPPGFTVIPQLQYSYSDKRVLSGKIALEKRLFQHGFLNLSYEQNFVNNLHMGEIGFRYDFKFAQTGVSARQSDNLTTLTQYARGSLINDSKTRYLGTDNRTNVGRGGITIIPFLDINSNGRRDKGEPGAYGLNLRAAGGRIERSEKDTTIRILGLEPYTDCFIELDRNSFDNIAWRLDKPTMNVAVSPNMLKLIEVPVAIVGNASGMVMTTSEGGRKGLSRMIVNFYNKDQILAGRTLTEEDGFFSYLGLAPGSYYVRIDTVQLRKTGMLSTPDSLNFKINANTEGDYVEGLDFDVIPKNIEFNAVNERKVLLHDTIFIIIHEVTTEVITSNKDCYAVQMGAFRYKSNAETLRKKLVTALGRKVEIFVEDGYYKVRITGFETRKEVDNFVPVLKRNGVNEMWIFTLKGMQKNQILVTRRDTLRVVTEEIVDIQPPAKKFYEENKVKPKNDSIAVQPEIKTENDVKKAPLVSMQVASFRNRNQAFEAQKKIVSKLNLPVEIIKENEQYKVIVTGFYSREETYKYYPVFVGLGFSEIYLIVKKKL